MATPKFKIEDGVLLKCYDNGCGIIEVPDTVTEIGPDAFNSFEDCRHVKEIILPDTVQKIGYHAFQAGWRDYGLEKVNIPSSVEWLSTRMFENDYYIQTIPFDEGTYLVEKYPRVYSAVPLPFVDGWPLPLDGEVYRKALAKRPDIKRIFVYHNPSWLKAVSVEEFLTLIDGVCRINKRYKCQYEWSGSLAGNFSGGYRFSPLSPAEIYFGGMPDSFSVGYRKDTLHEDNDGWPCCRSDIRVLSSADGRRVCFDTSEDDMAHYYGESKTIELLARIEDSPYYDSIAEGSPRIIQDCRDRETDVLRTFRPQKK